MVPPDLVDEAVGDGLAWEMRLRALPARLGVYFVLGLCLFSAKPYPDVIREVIKLRGGVMRDRVHREIDDVLDPEDPARLARALQQLFAGLCLIGVNRAEAVALIEQIAYDSAPKLRLKAFNALTDAWQKTRDVANAIKLPTTTTKRALEDLMAQGLALRDEDKADDETGDLINGKTGSKSGGAH